MSTTHSSRPLLELTQLTVCWWLSWAGQSSLQGVLPIQIAWWTLRPSALTAESTLLSCEILAMRTRMATDLTQIIGTLETIRSERFPAIPSELIADILKAEASCQEESQRKLGPSRTRAAVDAALKE